MASIQRRDNGKWRARYRDETGREHARHFDRKMDGQRWLDEVTAALVRRDWVDPAVAGNKTFFAWFEEWSARKIWTDGTRQSATLAARSTTFSDVPIAKIRPSHVEQWVKAMTLPAASRKNGLKPSTIKTRVNYVSMVFEGAVRDRAIPANPCRGVSLPAQRRRDAAMTMPTTEEVGLLLRHLEGEPFRAFVALCAFAGLRLGEAAGVQVGDVDFLRRTLTVTRQVQGQTNDAVKITPPKHGSERVVHLAPELVNLLADHVATIGTWGDEKWLFGSAADVRLNRNSAGHLWRHARRGAELPTAYTLHSLRHHYASGLIAAGCDVVTVQDALGHSSADITLKVYSHLWPKAADRTRAAASGLLKVALADNLRTENPQQGR